MKRCGECTDCVESEMAPGVWECEAVVPMWVWRRQPPLGVTDAQCLKCLMSPTAGCRPINFEDAVVDRDWDAELCGHFNLRTQKQGSFQHADSP